VFVFKIFTLTRDQRPLPPFPLHLCLDSELPDGEVLGLGCHLLGHLGGLLGSEPPPDGARLLLPARKRVSVSALEIFGWWVVSRFCVSSLTGIQALSPELSTSG
jgi:hypothetical protein